VAKSRMKCPLCKMSNMMDQMRKHPNVTQGREIETAIALFYCEAGGRDHLCELHAVDPKGCTTIIDHWLSRIDWLMKNAAKCSNRSYTEGRKLVLAAGAK